MKEEILVANTFSFNEALDAVIYGTAKFNKGIDIISKVMENGQ